MTGLDAAIISISAILAALAIAKKCGIGIAFIVLFSFTFNQWAITTLDLNSYSEFYRTGANWMAMIAVKDFIILCVLSYRLKKSEILIMGAFIASCLFHQICRTEFNAGDVDNMPVYDLRFTFMQVIAALQLAGVAINFTGSGWRGGKLVRLRFHRVNFFRRLTSYSKAFKAKR